MKRAKYNMTRSRRYWAWFLQQKRKARAGGGGFEPGDDFVGDDGDPPNSDKWGTPVLNDSIQSASYLIDSNSLSLSITSDGAGGEATLPATYQFLDDFDVQIKFSGINYSNNHRAGLRIDQPGETDWGDICAGAKSGSKFISYHKQLGLLSASRSSTTGGLRAIRAGNTVTVKYDEGYTGSWATLRTFSVAANTPCIISIWNWVNYSGVTDVIIYNDYTVNSGDAEAIE